MKVEVRKVDGMFGVYFTRRKKTGLKKTTAQKFKGVILLSALLATKSSIKCLSAFIPRHTRLTFPRTYFF